MLCFLVSSFAYAGGTWDDLLKTIRRNNAGTPEGAAARTELALARMAQEVGDEVITFSQAVMRLREVTNVHDANTPFGAKARCSLALMVLDTTIPNPGLTLEDAKRLLNEVVTWSDTGSAQGVAARFLLVRMRLKGQINDDVYTPRALIAFMREVIDHYSNREHGERWIAYAQARIGELLLLPEGAERQTAQEPDPKKARNESDEESARHIAEVERRLYPIVPPPPALPVHPLVALINTPNTNDNNSNHAAEETPDFGIQYLGNDFADWSL